MMRRTWILAAAATLATFTVGMASAQQRLPQESQSQPTAAVPKQEIAYGADPLQSADYWAAREPKAPLIMFVHGGGWKRGDKSMMAGSAKLNHWQDAGYAVASVNYRLVPSHSVEDQAADIAAATAFFRSNAVRLNIDPDRIVLIGYSAGAHLVALVGTDPQWLADRGLNMDAVAGIIALDGAVYDITEQMRASRRPLRRTYRQVFGTNRARHDRLSPTIRADGENAPAFLVLHIDRENSKLQSKGLTAALKAAGTRAEIVEVSGRGMAGHRAINTKLGKLDFDATGIVDTFLRDRFEQ